MLCLILILWLLSSRKWDWKQSGAGSNKQQKEESLFYKGWVLISSYHDVLHCNEFIHYSSMWNWHELGHSNCRKLSPKEKKEKSSKHYFQISIIPSVLNNECKDRKQGNSTENKGERKLSENSSKDVVMVERLDEILCCTPCSDSFLHTKYPGSTVACRNIHPTKDH